MKLTYKQIFDIADDLSCSMNVYINKENMEIRTIPDINSLYGDTDDWEVELDQIVMEWKDYVIISPMQSRANFLIMEAFIDEINDLSFQSVLINALNRKRPFAHFKDAVDNSDYREKWFEFRQTKNEDYVRSILEDEGIEFEESGNRMSDDHEDPALQV